MPTGSTTVSQAVRTAGLAARMRTHYELRAPLLPMAAAVAGTAMIGVAHYMTVTPPAPEPALQPQPRHADLLFEGGMLGIAVGAVYVVGRAVGEGNRPERRTVDFDTYRDELSRLLDLVDQKKLRTRRPRHARDGYPSCARQGRGARRGDPGTDHPASESFRARRTDRCLARQRRPRPRTRESGGTRSSARPQAAADDPLAGAPRVNPDCGLKTRTWDGPATLLLQVGSRENTTCLRAAFCSPAKTCGDHANTHPCIDCRM